MKHPLGLALRNRTSAAHIIMTAFFPFQLGSMQTGFYECVRVCVSLLDTLETKCKVGTLSGERRMEES